MIEGAQAPVGKIAAVQQIVCEHYGITRGDIRCAKRRRQLSWPRQTAMSLCRELTGRSLPQIGNQFGGRDHTTVLHAVRAVERRKKADPEYAEELRYLRTRVQVVFEMRELDELSMRVYLAQAEQAKWDDPEFRTIVPDLVEQRHRPAPAALLSRAYGARRFVEREELSSSHLLSSAFSPGV